MIESANRKVSALLASTGSFSVKDDGPRQCSHESYLFNLFIYIIQVYPWAEGSDSYIHAWVRKKRVIVRYSKQWGVDLKESTVRTWKTKCMEGLQKRKLTERPPIKSLPEILVDVVASYAAFNRRLVCDYITRQERVRFHFAHIQNFAHRTAAATGPPTWPTVDMY